MNNKLIILFLSTLLISFASCRKNYEPNITTNFETATYNPDFDWDTSHLVEIVISGASNQLVNITSVDDKIRYHRGMYLKEEGSYNVKLRLPKIVDQLKVNDRVITVKTVAISLQL